MAYAGHTSCLTAKSHHRLQASSQWSESDQWFVCHYSQVRIHRLVATGHQQAVVTSPGFSKD